MYRDLYRTRDLPSDMRMCYGSILRLDRANFKYTSLSPSYLNSSKLLVPMCILNENEKRETRRPCISTTLSGAVAKTSRTKPTAPILADGEFSACRRDPEKRCTVDMHSILQQHIKFLGDQHMLCRPRSTIEAVEEVFQDRRLSLVDTGSVARQTTTVGSS